MQQVEAVRRFLEIRFGPGPIAGKFPLEAFDGERLVQVEADLWIETADKIVVLQFAGYADSMKKWKHQAQSCAPVVGWIQWIVRQQFPGKAFEGWALFGVEGQAVRVV